MAGTSECFAVQYAIYTASWSRYYYYPYVRVQETVWRGESHQFVSAISQIWTQDVWVKQENKETYTETHTHTNLILINYRYYGKRPIKNLKQDQNTKLGMNRYFSDGRKAKHEASQNDANISLTVYVINGLEETE